MSLELDKIKIKLPEGVELTTEPSEVEGGFQFGVTPNKDTKGRIEVIYKGAVQYVPVTTPQIHVTSFCGTPQESTLFGGVVKLKATFDGKATLENFSITAPDGWTLVTPLADEDGTFTASYRAPHVAGDHKFSCQYKGDVTRDFTIKVVEPDNILMTAVFNPATVVKGSNTDLVLTFKKDVTEADQPSQVRGIENLTEVTRSSAGNTITITYTAKTEGEVTAAVTCHEGEKWETSRAAKLSITAE